jgi:hypothetical protein
MRASSVVSEAWRNLATGTSRPLLVVFLAAVVFGGIAAADIRTIVGLSAQAKEFRESGAAVHVLSAPASISGQRCDALGALPGVLGAGAVREPDTQAVFLTAPHSGILTVEATVGLAGVLGIREDTAVGVWVSDQAAESLGTGTEPGTTLPTSLGPVRVTAQYTYPDNASDRSLAYAAVAAVPPTGNFDSCWVRAWPPSEAIEPLIRGTYAGDPAEQSNAVVAQLNTELGATLDGPKMFNGRATSQAPMVAAVFGLLLGAGTVRARRLELAGALHAQVPKSALVTQVWLELLAMMLAAVIVILPLVFFLAAHGNPDPLWPARSAGLRVVASGALSALIGGLLTAATTSEKRLFRYFKDR